MRELESNSSIRLRQKRNASELPHFFRSVFESHALEQITFVCIGTDRSTGDALGPLLGTALELRGFTQVVGTLAHPCDATNLEARLRGIPADHIVIAIDACLGQPAMVGHYLVSKQPLQPAESVGGRLPAVGHYSIAAVVNVSGPKPYWTLQMTSLYKVMQMAQQIEYAIEAGLSPL
ncbi:spore protease YyaC [Paenibacillus selenitireducens]|uniref:Spore protease YyaC n=1 Tax=Paenibacillus selenitireducens TaxID=1324314 RepID=A0A1T2X3C2_9BACL|nr:spore protease YyaC [Paenibacillus selenitireducens]OPA74315.1 spore protease YyaC [Paenibacillus selenitireducens]